MTAPPVVVDPHWLALRGPADARARSDGAAALTGTLARYLRRGTAISRRPAALVDVGAGTGAGAAWLRPRLPVPQQWRLIDVDAALLAAAGPVLDGWARPVVADLADLPGILHDEPADVVTCQALLDLLTANQVRALLAPAVDAGSAVLLALSVTGSVALVPAHPDDAAVNDAFNAHQHRAGRLGPDAPACCVDLLRAQGYLVATAPTPWHLDGAQRELVDAWLGGRAGAAAEQDPARAGLFSRWLDQRRAALDRGEIAVAVGHVDLLAIPPER